MSSTSTLPGSEVATGHNRILKKIFSFNLALASLLVVLSVLTVRARFDDLDMWWHLKTGEIVWTTHTIPVTDLFSYTTNHHASIPQEWLAQTAMYGAYRLGGLSGLMLWHCILTSILLVAGFLLCSLYSGNSKVGFAGAMAIWLFATIGIAIRPQMIGYLLLIVELILIHLGRTRNPRWFFCLPPLFALWVNCHGSFFLGLLVAGAFVFASFFNFQAGSLVARSWDPRCRRMLVWAFVLSVAALFLNPVGISQILYPVNTLLHQPLGLSSVDEWKATPFSDARGVALLAVIFSILLLPILRRADLYWDELVLLLAGAWLALNHERMLFVFGILAAPILSRQLSTYWEGYRADQDRIWPNAVVIGIALLVSVWVFPSPQFLAGQVEKQSPVKAVEFMRAHHISGRMLNDYGFGGYLIWAAPEYPVFVDGRADVFEWSGVFADYANWVTLQTDPNELLDKYKIDFCLLTRDAPNVNVLRLMHDWKVVYSDRNSILFVRARSGNAAGS